MIAPSRSLAIISPSTRAIADARFSELGLELSFGRHVETSDRFVSAPIVERVGDLHEAFADPDVDAVLTVIGGYNSNQLLPYLDWDLIGANPKIFCGYSDITALSCAITTMTGLVTYSGPHYSTFGMRDHLETTLRWFTEALFTTSLTQQPGFDSVRALLIGRFEPHVGMDRSTLAAIVGSKRELDRVPVVANVDFGHTDPLLTIPVGGHATVAADPTASAITFST